jgi:hypothetical protein
MTMPAHTFVAPDLPPLLRRLHQAFLSGDDAALRTALAAVEPEGLATTHAVIGALCIGGSQFALRLVAHAREELPPHERLAIVVDTFLSWVEPPQAAPADHEQRLAQRLIDDFGLQAGAQALLDTLRADILIEAGPLDELPQAIESALRHAQWELGLRGLVRVRQSLQSPPRASFGMAAMCLHKLGRYEEADRWIDEGLGELKGLLSIGAVYREDELLQRWGGETTPVVSILCPTYNHERYIDSAIRGFLSQDCPLPFEILIHDDASSDRTQQVIRRWQAQYPRIIRATLQTQNQLSRGVRPLELMLAQARGQYVATCEGDDFWIDPAKLRRQVGFLQAHPEFSCTVHNYYHLHESALTVRPWFPPREDFILDERQLMAVRTVLWVPTLVFRKTFSAMPPERNLAPIGDQFLTSWLGTQGRCHYFASVLGAVRRENEFSMWSPLSSQDKETMRVKTWAALVRLHQRLGHAQAVADLATKIAASPLDEAERLSILDAYGITAPQPVQEAA